MNSYAKYVHDLNHEYAALHTSKEDAFWTAYMGLSDDADAAQTDLDEKEVLVKRFLQSPERLADLRAEIARAEAALDESAAEQPTSDHMTAYAGWLATLEANTIDSEEARALSEEIVAAEGALGRARGSMKLGYEDPEEGFVEASSVKLAVMANTNPDEALRRAAWDGLRSIEGHVLANGYLGVVKLRNKLARMLGFEDYYDMSTTRNEGMTKAEVFERLDDLSERTQDSGSRYIADLIAREGTNAAQPHNVRFYSSGDIVTEQDPYFPFGKAIDRWGRSFAALGIRYQDAELVLDLVDRKGKYSNGFMHAPEIAWRDEGELKKARIHFTANAIPGMVGSGHRASVTLFHEGGHAADFANTDMPAPCFGQEFAPTSGSFAETQSMFLDSLLSDPDWQARYAQTKSGEEMPFELIEKSIKKTQPYLAWDQRFMMSVCYSERAIYELPDDELTPERVLEVVREQETRMVSLEEGSARPVLSIPHLLSGEASCAYHNYVLAEMAVHQTRSFFLERDGHLVDNPQIGPDLREFYWKPGNSLGFLDFIENLTGKPLTAEAIAKHINRTVDEALSEARDSIAKLKEIPTFDGTPELDAKIRVAHGNETVAEMVGGDFEAMSAQFESWVEAQISSAN